MKSTAVEAAPRKVQAGKETPRPARARSFSLSFLVIGATSAGAFAIQRLRPDFSASLTPVSIAVLAGLAGFATLAIRRRKTLFHLLSSAPFAVALLLVLAVSTIAGTWILQNASPEDYRRVYGGTAGTIVRALSLDDIFHSLWFRSLLGLMALSLVLVTIRRRPFRPSQWGFLASHTGVIVILLGALIGSLRGKKGFLPLLEGRGSTSMFAMEKGKTTDREEALGFGVRLDDFQVEYHKAKHKIYVYRKRTGKHDEKNPYEAIASFDVLEARRERKVAGTGIRLRIVEESLTPDHSGHDHRPKHVLTREGSDRRISVRVGKGYSLGDGWTVDVARFVPHFSYDVQLKKAVNRSDEPRNPALQVVLRKGEVRRPLWLFAKMPEYASQHGKDTKDLPRLVYAYVSPHGAHRASVLLTVWSRDGEKKVRLADDPYHALFLEEGRFAIQLAKRDNEVRAYRSLVSIWDKGKEVRKGTIEVNSPLAHDGYMIYQSSYDPRNLRYSGLLVVKDPGLYFVYAGFVLLLLGVVWIIYIRPRILRAKVRARAEGAQ